MFQSSGYGLEGLVCPITVSIPYRRYILANLSEFSCLFENV